MAGATIDDIFYNDFKIMMKRLKDTNQPVLQPLYNAQGTVIKDDFPIPAPFLTKYEVFKTDKVVVHNIVEDFYSALNDKTGLYYYRKGGVKQDLNRRLIDSQGNYIQLDERGNYVTEGGTYQYEHVTKPDGSEAFFFPIPIGVKQSYKPKEEGFDYVDKMDKATLCGVETDLFMYIIPKKYCFRVNQTALIVSFKQAKDFYYGVEMATRYGRYIYLHIVPYQPLRNGGSSSTRVIATDTKPDNLIGLAKQIQKYWIDKGLVFNPVMCNVSSGLHECNMALTVLEPTLSLYNYCEDIALDGVTQLEQDYNDADTEFVEDDFGVDEY